MHMQDCKFAARGNLRADSTRPLALSGGVAHKSDKRPIALDKK